MDVLFSQPWMHEFAQSWNDEKGMTESLATADFSTVIGFGYQDEDTPRGVIEVLHGRVATAGEYSGQTLAWDLRASLEDWQEWLTNGFGLAKLGVAVSSGRLNFLAGDYRRMIRNPALANPFLKHFELMSSLKTEFSR